jgi:hypothetical protein
MSEPAARLALEPAAVQCLCHDPELNDEVGREIFCIEFASLLLLKPNQRRLIVAHDGSCVRSANV